MSSKLTDVLRNAFNLGSIYILESKELVCCDFNNNKATSATTTTEITLMILNQFLSLIAFSCFSIAMI